MAVFRIDKTRDYTVMSNQRLRIIAAVNCYFDREARLTDDPYLESREKEDIFLQRVLNTIRAGIQESGAGSLGSLAALLQNVQPSAPPDAAAMTDEDFDTAMDFINSL